MDAWLLAAELVAETRDLLHARPLSGHEDEVVAARGWLGFLEGLDEATLVALEVGGLEAEWPTATPASLRDLIDRLRVACTVPSLEANESRRALGLRESPAKRAQIEAFSRVLAPIACARAAWSTSAPGTVTSHGPSPRRRARRWVSSATRA